eukprot:scaffold25307_cov109-Isochrysis_galbana.AAC.17
MTVTGQPELLHITQIHWPRDAVKPTRRRGVRLDVTWCGAHQDRWWVERGTSAKVRDVQV